MVLQRLQRKQLQEALLDAFPDRAKLGEMVYLELDKNLETIAADSNLRNTIFELIRWAEAYGYTQELIKAALRANPDNPQLRTFAAQLQISLGIDTLSDDSAVTTDTLPAPVPPPSPVDLQRIFIGRDEQIKIFRNYLSRWYHQASGVSTFSIDEAPSFQNQIQGLVALIYGMGGSGKSTLLRHYRDIALEIPNRLAIGPVIDWELISGRSIVFSGLRDDIDALSYFNMLYRYLAYILGKQEENFKEYKRVIMDINEIAKHIDAILKSVGRRSAYSPLLSLTRQSARQVINWLSSPDFSGPSSQQVENDIKDIVGEGTGIQLKHLLDFYAEVRDKLGARLDMYLQSALPLGLALGRDLRLFSMERPIMIFLDGYQAIQRGDIWLRVVMGAAGTRVGWVIAGQNNLLNSFEHKQNGVIVHGYQDIVRPDHLLAIDLNVAGSGSFTFDDIITYFTELRRQNPLLPALDTTAAEQIWHVTQGNPLAVSATANLYVRKPDLQIITATTEASEIIDQVIRRCLSHLSDNSIERVWLYTLAVLRRIDNAASVIAYISDAQKERKELAEMYRQYGFVFVEKGQPFLHQQFRRFLRLWLLDRPYELERTQVNVQMMEAYRTYLGALEERRPYSDLRSRLEDEEWVSLYLDWIEAQFWLDIHGGILSSLLFMLAAAAYRPDTYYAIVEIGMFFQPVMKQPYSEWWKLAVQCLQPHMGHNVNDEILEGLQVLDKLMEGGRLNNSSPITKYIEELEAILWWQLGRAYQEYNEQIALKWYQKALSRLSNQAELEQEIQQVYWITAFRLYHEGSYRQSIETLNEALVYTDLTHKTRAGKYNLADIYYSLGNAEYALKKYSDAIVCYEYAIEYAPDHSSAYMNLGNARDAMKDYQHAIDEYNTALALASDDAQIYYNRANSYTAIHNYQAALKDLDRSIELDPTCAWAYMNRGNVYAFCKEYSKVLDDYNQAARLAPADINVVWTATWASFGKTLISSEDVKKLETIVQLAADSYIACVCKGIIAGVQHNNLKAALREFEQAIALEPEEWDPYFWQGIAYAYRRNTSAAKQALEKALTFGLPPLLLTPLYWLKEENPDFFIHYAQPLLERYELS
jgi:tetratricopeptide (TPR) repeat protein